MNTLTMYAILVGFALAGAFIGWAVGYLQGQSVAAKKDDEILSAEEIA